MNHDVRITPGPPVVAVLPVVLAHTDDDVALVAHGMLAMLSHLRLVCFATTRATLANPIMTSHQVREICVWKPIAA